MKRFWDKVDLTDDCWTWQAALTYSGYGAFKFAGRMVRAHRFAYEMMVGEIPEGLQLDHLCRNRACVKPSHLEPVTQQENTRRGDVFNDYECKNGHPRTAENTIVYANGHRTCRECKQASERAYRARRKAASS